MRDTVKGAGIAGEYESPTLGHFQSVKLTLNWRTANKDMFQLLRQVSQRLDCRGAFQEYDAARGVYNVKQMRVLVQGPPTKVDPGKFETGTPSGGSTEIEVLYLKIDFEGETFLEFEMSLKN